MFPTSKVVPFLMERTKIHLRYSNHGSFGRLDANRGTEIPITQIQVKSKISMWDQSLKHFIKNNIFLPILEGKHWYNGNEHSEPPILEKEDRQWLLAKQRRN